MATPPGVATTTAGNPPPSEIQTSPNLVQFDPKLVVPTQPIYLQRNDILVFTGITNDLAATIQVNYRYLTPEGEIKEGQYIFQASSPNIFFYFSIFEGWLLSFTIRQTDSVIAGTWSYVQVFVARTPPATLLGVTQGLLWEGYVPYNLSIGWPGSPSKEATDGAGVLRSITGTMPGVGAEISEVVPNQRRWILLVLRAALMTSATVANRQVAVYLDDGTNTFYATRAAALQTAIATWYYCFAPGIPYYYDTINNVTIPIPSPTVLRSGFRIKTNTNGLQAGDQWYAPEYLVLEWGLWDA
ncbi:MAG TPA: hypothetical protein VJY15_11370 [Candidatus Acidoferrum sp.]|nr:hypothetical protein [Candidatus Acidoferrum sp.]